MFQIRQRQRRSNTYKMVTYTEEQALEASIQYFNGNEKAAKIWLSKYCLKDNDGNIYELTPDDMHWRIAKEIARIEEKKFKNPLTEKEVYEYIKDFERIIFQGSPSFGIGNPYQIVSLSNCFVVESPHDSYSGIMKLDEHIAQISKRRGGIGYDISTLRPKGMPVNNAARTTTGAVSFMHRFSNTGREVGQGGRRGAQMITIDIHHPDIEDFITIKNDEVSVTGANISPRVSNEFMIAVEENTTYKQWWGSKKNAKEVFAKPIWDLIIESAWSRAEPGVLFWDRIINECPADCYEYYGFNTISTNPCGEINLSAYDSCRLLVLNTFAYVKNPFTNDASFDFDKFYDDAKIAQRFMDDLVDLEKECISRIIKKIELELGPGVNSVELDLWKRIEIACASGRRTGTGVLAIGDTIAGLGLKYGSDESIYTVEKIYKNLKHACYESSIEMAEELGPFPIWNHELERKCAFLKRIKDERPDLWERMKKSGRRNISLLTTAPTGTISQLSKIGPYFETTSGIEPLFTWKSYIRRKKVNHNDKDITIDFVDKLGDKWTNFEVRHSGIQYFLDANPGKTVEDSPYYGATANEIDWLKRVKLQGRANLHVDHSISSTLNLPADVTKEKVSEIYLTAWKLGCKGVTIYRDGCRSGVLVTKTEEKEKIKKTDAPKRPKDLLAEIHTFKIAGKEYTAFVGLLESEPYEILVKTNSELSRNIKNGTVRKIKRGHYQAIVDGEIVVDSITDGMSHEEEALTRMVSTALRHGADISYIVHQLEKTKGDMISFAKCLSRTLKKYIQDGVKVSGETCQKCESHSLIRQEGCITCQNCGWSKCG